MGTEFYFAALALACGCGTAIAALGCGIGQGLATKGALEGVARQPEAANRIMTLLIIGLALIESLTIYALVLGFMLYGKLPDPATILNAVN